MLYLRKIFLVSGATFKCESFVPTPGASFGVMNFILWWSGAKFRYHDFAWLKCAVVTGEMKEKDHVKSKFENGTSFFTRFFPGRFRGSFQGPVSNTQYNDRAMLGARNCRIDELFSSLELFRT